MFEQRILCHKLPKSFDAIEPILVQEQCESKSKKLIQESKRQMLHAQMENYENRIQYYEDLYQQDLNKLQLQILNPNPVVDRCQIDILMYCVQLYFNHYTNRLIRQIRYKESCLHAKLLRHSRRHLLTSKAKDYVYPQILVDVPKPSLNQIQLDYLSRNGKLKYLLDTNNILFFLS